jgi:hypothetical protein
MSAKSWRLCRADTGGYDWQTPQAWIFLIQQDQLCVMLLWAFVWKCIVSAYDACAHCGLYTICKLKDFRIIIILPVEVSNHLHVYSTIYEQSISNHQTHSQNERRHRHSYSRALRRKRNRAWLAAPATQVASDAIIWRATNAAEVAVRCSRGIVVDGYARDR